MAHTLLAELPNRKLTVLHNGVKVASWQDDSLGDRVYFGIGIAAGSNSDPIGKAGLTHFTEHNLSSTTTEHAIRRMGGWIDLSTSRKDMSTTAGVFTCQFISQFKQVVQDLKTPDFRQARMEVERNRILREIAERGFLTNMATLQLACRNMPYNTHPILGSTESVKSITAQDVRTHWQNIFQPERITVGMISNVSHATAIALAEEHFGGMSNTGSVIHENNSPFYPATLVRNAFNPEVQASVIFKLPETNPVMGTLIANLLGSIPDLSIVEEISRRRGLVYDSSVQAKTTGTQHTLNLDYLFEARHASEIGAVVSEKTRNLALHLTPHHLATSAEYDRFCTLEQKPSPAVALRTLLNSAMLRSELPLTPAEDLARTVMPSFDEVRCIANYMFKQPPAVAISSRDGIGFMQDLRPDFELPPLPQRKGSAFGNMMRKLAHRLP